MSAGAAGAAQQQVTKFACLISDPGGAPITLQFFHAAEASSAEAFADWWRRRCGGARAQLWSLPARALEH